MVVYFDTLFYENEGIQFIYIELHNKFGFLLEYEITNLSPDEKIIRDIIK